MLLSDLLEGFTHQNLPEFDITDIENDSRKVRENSLFVAASGYTDDAHPFIPSAYENGARVFVVEKGRSAEFSNLKKSVFIEVEDAHFALGVICQRFFKNPTSKMTLIGITGTNGKTTTATAVFNVLENFGIHAGMVGTIAYHVHDEVFEATNTTPDLLSLYRLFSRMVEKEVSICVMEVSSHALSLGRVNGLQFDCFGFTNFTQDHLDFHGSMDAYLSAKLLAFDHLQKSAKTKKTFIVNCDMDYFVEVKKQAEKFPQIRFKSYSLKNKKSDFYSEILELTPSYSRFLMNGIETTLSMVGDINVSNFTLAAALIHESGFSYEKILPLMKSIRVKGRMQTIPLPRLYHAIVDYAHTPDALENLLLNIRKVMDKEGRLICLFGAGGDRDKKKRPLMGKIAVELSDVVIVTSDNPRTEEPKSIIKDILVGVNEARKEKEANLWVEEDRRKAIELAVKMAKNHDVIAVAGKGHEDYQIIGKIKTHFSDGEEILRASKL